MYLGAWNYINKTVKQNPWKMIFVSAISSGLTVLFLLPNLPQQIYNWLLFPFSAGAFAAFLNWMFTYKKEKAQLTLSYISCEFFPYNDSDSYKSPYRLIIWLRILNESSLPISILQFDLNISNYETIHSYSHNVAAETYELPETRNGQIFLPIGENQLKPIIILSPYHATEGYVFFPFCPNFTEQSIEATLTVITTRGNFIIKVRGNPSRTSPVKGIDF